VRPAVAVALISIAFIAPGNRATATFSGGTLTLTLHYLMTCGQPGPGPVAVTLPRAFRIGSMRATVSGKAAPVSLRGRTVDVTLPKPPEVTCMSIGEGTLRVTIAGLHVKSGRYTLSVRVNRNSFSPPLRVG
jgi:hypothetical protein